MKMKMMTEVNCPSSNNCFQYHDNIMLIGSCFSEHMGNRIAEVGINSLQNPFGILYNPHSILTAIRHCIDDKPIEENMLFYHNELWNSPLHHSDFSDTDKIQCLTKCNTLIKKAHLFLKETNHLVITLGSAWYYVLNRSNLIVGNCHKLPQTNYTKKIAVLEEIVQDYIDLISCLRILNPEIDLLFTVSPIRHWKEGYRQNQISKSILHLFIYHLQSHFSFVNYFPAYEIMMDELRDYRFYNADLLHPNTQAIDYIWEKFYLSTFSSKAIDLIEMATKINIMKKHRPRFENTVASKNHSKLIEEQEKLFQLAILDT